MIQDIGELTYDNHFEPLEPTAESYVLHYHDRGVLVSVTRPGEGGADAGSADDVIELPRLADYPEAPERIVYLFSIGDERYFLALDEIVTVPRGFAYEAMSWVRHATPAHLLFAAATGYQLSNWYADNRFCSRCGHATELVRTSREIACPECGKVVYPKIQPGVICAVTQGDRIVLTKYAGRAGAWYALVAGFTEVGETIEETVHREVMEEVGLNVRNLRYYKSQPWSFSDTLLMGFWCEVDGDASITVDQTELKEARWFTREEMPDERVRDRASLTGEMIERFRALGHDVFEG